MSGQTVTDSGIALVVLNHVDVQEATTILAKDLSYRWPLPSSWFFDHGERVQLALHYGPFTRDAEIDDEITSGSEGWIECVHSSGCDVAFINQANAPSLDDDLTVLGVRFIPFRFLIKVMQVGSRVEVRQDLGVAREGLVVAVGDVIAVKFNGSDDLTHPFHANSLKNLSLMPQIHLAHEPYHPRNELPTMGQPGTSNSLIDTSTGRIPWANTEIKVVGVENNNFAQMHKGSLGRVMDVVKNSSMKSGIGILVRFDAPPHRPILYLTLIPGYIPTHSPAEIRHVYGHPERIMQIQNERLSEARKKLEDEERAKDAARERLAIPSFGNRLENATFTQGGAPLTLRAGTPPPWTDWSYLFRVSNKLAIAHCTGSAWDHNIFHLSESMSMPSRTKGPDVFMTTEEAGTFSLDSSIFASTRGSEDNQFGSAPESSSNAPSKSQAPGSFSPAPSYLPLEDAPNPSGLQTSMESSTGSSAPESELQLPVGSTPSEPQPPESSSSTTSSAFFPLADHFAIGNSELRPRGPLKKPKNESLCPSPRGSVDITDTIKLGNADEGTGQGLVLKFCKSRLGDNNLIGATVGLRASRLKR
ncbi:hypothetical protein BT96DRAFT_991169 [Gymnopus androsaceus JB14]|uniref:Uncharacterized protein n=1 Tax=Gymnopus androsaceus JB14 TaxID=1447944 RepID=A0A6A4I093_9AGAR|nr:hypothetical protein BT96DRAFT_991169 [Gymnopus androsaceus JB14]